MKYLVLLVLVVLTACNRADKGAADNGTVTNAGTIGKGLTNPPPTVPVGSGRLDQGGGQTDARGSNSPIRTNGATGQTNRGPATGPLPQ